MKLTQTKQVIKNLTPLNLDGEHPSDIYVNQTKTPMNITNCRGPPVTMRHKTFCGSIFWESFVAVEVSGFEIGTFVREILTVFGSLSTILKALQYS